MPGELACGNKSTQHARGVSLREGEYLTCPRLRPTGKRIPNMPGELACGIKILNMPGELACGKKKIGV
jgi:hypothetical protein